MEYKYKIAEAFDSVEGEGKRSGMPTSFVRLSGCNLRCSYCDTSFALSDEEYWLMSTDEILSRLNRNFMRVTLTGGEPLITPDVEELVQAMVSEGFEVNIETNGSINIRTFLGRLPQVAHAHAKGRLFLTIDYKLPTSGHCDDMIFSNYMGLTPWDVIKFVVGNQEDISEMLSLLRRIQQHYIVMPQIFIGAVYDGFHYKELAKVILNDPLLKDAHLQLQIHKIIWGPEVRGV